MIAPEYDKSWLRRVIAGLPGADLFAKEDWGALILDVGGKQFGRLGTDTDGRRILTVKGDPLENEALRAEFAEVVPGYYSNKKHWNSVQLEETTVPEERMRELVVGSYELVFASLTRLQRAEILATHAPGPSDTIAP